MPRYAQWWAQDLPHLQRKYDIFFHPQMGVSSWKTDQVLLPQAAWRWEELAIDVSETELWDQLWENWELHTCSFQWIEVSFCLCSLLCGFSAGSWCQEQVSDKERQQTCAPWLALSSKKNSKLADVTCGEELDICLQMKLDKKDAPCNLA